MAIVEIRSEVTGSVWQIKKQLGDAVADGDVVMIIESMKMEIPVLVEDPGRVTNLMVKEGEAVSEGQLVALIET
ncbi:MAG: acetyl-CoA carboxylase biotin carboxyl carrier protein subunit [Burkholderiaceae bacterium]